MSKEPIKEAVEIEKKPEAEEIREILSTVSLQLPQLIKNLFSSLYSSEIAAEYGKSIAMLYKQLKEEGLPEEMIREIVMNYAKSINLLGNTIHAKGALAPQGIHVEKKTIRSSKKAEEK
ncbi:MAG: hypothetical protein DRI86_15280 [Bacteroidetes bacterium]|nr:MAG: hypothetical protein DRI86_15280 [Bacteroidota bacterium]